MDALTLHKAVAEVAPISGVSVGDADDRNTWSVSFLSGATVVERAAAAEVVATIAEPVKPTIVSKNAIWERATDAEAAQMDAALNAQPVRIRRIYEGATVISSTDELFDTLQAALVNMFGADRAAQLLTPNE